MKLVPVGNKVVVRQVDAEEKTAGGIVLPDGAREKPREGRVLSVGDGTQLDDGRRIPCQVREGDRVLFSSWGGTEIEADGDTLLIMSEDDILAVLT